MIQKEDITIIITWPDEHRFLIHNLDILDSIPILNGIKVRADNFSEKAETNGQLILDMKEKHQGAVFTTHKENHGVRIYELLRSAETPYVIVFDSDFFCGDERFWKDIIIQLEYYDIISIAYYNKDQIVGDCNLSTAFIACHKDKLLNLVPTKKLWQRSIDMWPNAPPYFDTLGFVFLQCCKSLRVLCIKPHEYNFYHFWGSRESVTQIISESFEITSTETARVFSRVFYKLIFFWITKNTITSETKHYEYIKAPKLWETIGLLVQYGYETQIEVFLSVFEHQIKHKNEHLKGFRSLRAKFLKGHFRCPV